VICLVGVRPSRQRQGIGTQLLDRCQSYLHSKGTRTYFAGPIRPLNPFYLGLYGGSEMPGFLNSDTAAEPFFISRGYVAYDTALVFHRSLDRPVEVPDGRFPGLRRRFAVRVSPRMTIGSWWQECVLGSVEPVEFHLEETQTGKVVATAEVWEMEGFSWRWGLPTVGILNISVQEPLRRQGLAKFLLAQILSYLKDQYFGLVEVQSMTENVAATNLYRSLGFEQVDFGRVYKREPTGTDGG
jgi:ribosomal protein S18 acetylase RimI-like enzyme